MRKTIIHCPTVIVNANNNGGFHPRGRRAYRKAVRRILDRLKVYKAPRLYHICFQLRSNVEHKKLLHALVQRLNRRKIPCEWFAARETDSDKGEHLHVFILVDSYKSKAQNILSRFEGLFLGKECAKRKILLHINKPRNRIHNENGYAALPYLGPGNRSTELGLARLKDALLWLTYIYKARGKAGSEIDGIKVQIFSSSRPNRLGKPKELETT